ncbi:shufflon system plasmid conjugative transfer pilus tip adhesin PilV [Enterobacter cloacae complex sp. P31C]|uniref:shufflon system plasmid conjugative transfer pilus tip adhesin PilV n=1 Tax=Enterobacter cloacae complex sp. P31C TaxID=2779560 RepID=UPI001865C4C7|nr:shufflon system plasmid conjugative transfer pilus tip adhesin PilV [Enterobacter cloacae complex sp. P31C]MBE3289174.1 shufflon system plasmid conjugative transfer pilus tip adhesin PilV [Enterobacter cloacae complex sp. P31C]
MKKKIHRGMVSIEIAVALVIVMIAGIYGMSRYSQYLTELEWSVEARHMDAVTAAAKSYIRDNRETLQNQVGAGGSVKLTGAQLQQAGYLPQGFTLTNTSAQTFQVAIVRNPTDNTKLVGFVLTQGGQPISYKGLRYIAQSINGAGGYIQTANQAEGAYGSWKMNLSSYGLTGESGRLAVWLSSDVLGADDQESDRLYRYALASRPELNRMHTAIDMNNNNLNNVGTVNAKTGTFTENITAKNGGFSQGVTAQTGTFSNNINAQNGTINETLYAKNGTITETLNAKNGVISQGLTTGSDIRSNDGWIITQNSKGWMNATHGGGWYMSDDDWMRSLNDKNIYTGGQVRAGTILSNGRLTTNEFLQLSQVATAGTSCSPNGLVGRDVSGGILTCQNGVWVSGGKGREGYYCRYTSMSKGKSEDYVGLEPRTDRNCPVISLGQIQGECACMKVILDY